MKLDLGCGEHKEEGYTGIDINPFPTVDIVADLNLGIPVPDNSVDEIRAQYVLSMIKDLNFIMEEMYRVCKHGALVHIKVPYYMSEAAIKDPLHVRSFCPRTFEYFDRDYIEGRVKGHKLPEYNVKCDMKLVSIGWLYYHRGLGRLPFIKFLREHFFNIAKQFHITLRVNKV
jgi:SAM-dependent methyltransferase